MRLRRTDLKRRIPGMIEFSFVRARSASERICEEAVKRECLGRSHRLLFLLEEAVEQRWLGRGGNDRRHMRDSLLVSESTKAERPGAYRGSVASLARRAA